MNLTAEDIFSIKNADEFNSIALNIFKLQARNCNVYREYIFHLGVDADEVSEIAQIPFLPISFFKSHSVLSSTAPIEVTFSSSGTTGMIQSSHHVTDAKLYEQSYLQAFTEFYGDVTDYCFLALLPSYQQRSGSSLIYMVNDLIEKSKHPQSGYFLYNHDELLQTLLELQSKNQKTILIGVTYALLDFIEQYDINFPGLIVMETGGMKGKRKEMVREELHEQLTKGFGVKAIHSEYGMTELLSQAYSLGEGIFNCPNWMQVLIRDTNDPLSLIENGRTGGINVIDLANINSCSFIATQDLGRINPDQRFEVLGRFDNADIRGCNLLVQ
ncbi:MULTISPECIES: acyl transferase [unclassified Pedobacter]|uniref:LuxE/PaaK family acyltransferase n=1 Tax=unclassified Pedobacter TaxID=2628915 RepID=UPI0018483CB9|nr:acyl transferase [Pedobacter sp. SG918]NII81404.1 phenylacetate-coenzyme A ligase PaaK-like adenylate-forming protein [Pedobacter sp. SG908]NMN35409.1 phenylacetate-coenzyme A ligase PaaK-like adenylate-forming protein [Pedobacter sp. SG918]